MFYKNINAKKKVKKMTLNFTRFEKAMNTEVDDALMPYKTAKLSYNFNVKNGSLRSGYGFKALTLPGNLYETPRVIVPPTGVIKKLWFYKYYSQTLGRYNNQIIIYLDGGDIYTCNIVSDSVLCGKIIDTVFSSGVPNALNYRLNSLDTMIFSSETDGMWTYTQNQVVQRVLDAPHIKSMCLHYERLFAVVGGERNRLAFSANLDPTDWGESMSSGGFIDMQDERGALSRVISYNDYVYVFRDYGVSRVSAYGEQSQFSVSHLFTSSVKLYGDTVTLCGNKVLLLARDGIHVFDGYATRKLNLGIDELFNGVDNDNACGLYYNNKFYLACRLNFNDNTQVGCETYVGGYKNNALIELDLSTNELLITRGVDISSMLALDDGKISKLVASFNGEHSGKIGELTKDGKVFGTPLKKMWLSPKSSMGYPGQIKHIEECVVKTNTDCNMIISTDKQSRVVNLPGGSVAKRIKINVFGEQMQVGFMINENTDKDIEITCPQIVVAVTDRWWWTKNYLNSFLEDK